jgi:ABC-type bacteriocin/lantibiotic exporter with double-glycine peptidase domain
MGGLMRTWLLFARLFADSKRLLLASLALSVAQSLLLVPIGLLVKHAFDVVIPAGDRLELAEIALVMLALYLASVALALLTRHTVLTATKAATTRLRIRVLERLFELPAAYHDAQDVGTLHATVVQDTDRFDLMTYGVVAFILPAIVISTALAAALVTISASLFLVLAAAVPVMLVVSYLLSAHVRARTRVWQAAFAVFSSETLVALRAMTFFKVHAADDRRLRDQLEQIREFAASGRMLVWMQSAYGLVIGSLAATAGVVVLVVGGLAVIDGRMTLGELLSFYTLVALLRSQLTSVMWAAPAALVGRESLERLRAILEAPERDPYDGTRAIDFTGSVDLDDVTFSYGNGDEPVLHEVDASLRPGEVVALVGPNGAGKSTFARLVVGLYRPQRGRVLAEGVPFDELDLRALRRRIGVVEQDPFIFPTTVRENIALGLEDASDDDVRAAAVAAGVDRFVHTLRNGYDTEVGSEGALLSGGQRQRVAIARALVRCPALLVLDEPTTSLDHEAVERLLDDLRHLSGSPAVLVISHNPAVVRAADRVYMLRAGRAVGVVAASAATAAKDEA